MKVNCDLKEDLSRDETLVRSHKKNSLIENTLSIIKPNKKAGKRSVASFLLKLVTDF